MTKEELEKILDPKKFLSQKKYDEIRKSFEEDFRQHKNMDAFHLLSDHQYGKTPKSHYEKKELNGVVYDFPLAGDENLLDKIAEDPEWYERVYNAVKENAYACSDIQCKDKKQAEELYRHLLALNYNSIMFDHSVWLTIRKFDDSEEVFVQQLSKSWEANQKTEDALRTLNVFGVSEQFYVDVVYSD